ncbi:MAG: hypothetical protein ACE5HE_09160 [Phycisphaerae bacterium]
MKRQRCDWCGIPIASAPGDAPMRVVCSEACDAELERCDDRAESPRVHREEMQAAWLEWARERGV